MSGRSVDLETPEPEGDGGVIPSPSNRLVWYASYGSNLCADRFACYIEGGRPPRATHTHAGAKDRRPPLATVALAIPYRLYFTDVSTGWGGSPAFIDTERSDVSRSLVRGYLITWAQFEDVVAQENARASSPITVGELTDGAFRLIGPGRYENLLCVGQRDGVPIVTFTAPWALSAITPAEPSMEYLAMLIAGLREAHGLDDNAIVDYLGAAPGCTPELARRALVV
jgi:hypothetical protein